MSPRCGRKNPLLGIRKRASGRVQVEASYWCAVPLWVLEDDHLSLAGGETQLLKSGWPADSRMPRPSECTHTLAPEPGRHGRCDMPTLTTTGLQSASWLGDPWAALCAATHALPKIMCDSLSTSGAEKHCQVTEAGGKA